jgi:hypothetical protein
MRRRQACAACAGLAACMVEGARDQAVHCPLHRLRRSPSPATRGRMEKRTAQRAHRAGSQVVTGLPV